MGPPQSTHRRDDQTTPIPVRVSGLQPCMRWAARAVLVVGLLHVAEPQMVGDYSDVWAHFAVLVWQYRTPAPGPGARRAYEAVNLSGIHLDDGFSDEVLQFAVASDYEYYVDHAAGKGDLHLYEREWRPFFDAYREDRARPERPRCLHDPSVRARMLEKLRRNIPRAKQGLCLAYAFDDEISTTSFTAPADVCWAAPSMAAFREWLRARYGSIEALNARWGTQFAAFEEAEPLTVDAVRAVHSLPFSRWRLARWADHREFMDDTLADVLGDLRAEANRLDPARPAGFVGGQAPAAYGGYDYAKLARAVQWMEAYDIGATDEILRSFWGTARPRVQTFFLTGKRHVDVWFLWRYLVHGNRGVILWPEIQGRPLFDGSTPLPEVRALAPTFAETQGLISERFIGAQFDHDGIGVYYSQPSIRVSWMMDIESHGASWVNRSSSLNNSNASDILNRVAWTKWLEDSGFQYEFVSYLDVQEGRADLSRYRVLILPRTFALSDGEAQALTDFAARGGTLIADYGTATFDEHGDGRPRGALDAVFGVTRADGNVLDGRRIAEVEGEKYQLPLRERVNMAGARRVGEFIAYERILRGLSGTQTERRSAGADVVVKKGVGRGRARYLNVTPIPYLWLRREPAGTAYRDLLTSLLAEAGIRPRVEVWREGAPAHTVERLMWRKGGATYLCLVENPLRDAAMDGIGTDALSPARRETVELRFAKDVRALHDERANRAVGSGRTFRVDWCPHEAAIFRIEWEASSRQ